MTPCKWEPPVSLVFLFTASHAVTLPSIFHNFVPHHCQSSVHRLTCKYPFDMSAPSRRPRGSFRQPPVLQCPPRFHLSPPSLFPRSAKEADGIETCGMGEESGQLQVGEDADISCRRQLPPSCPCCVPSTSHSRYQRWCVRVPRYTGARAYLPYLPFPPSLLFRHVIFKAEVDLS